MPRFTLPQWEDIVENFYKKYPGIKAIQAEWTKIVRRDGQLILPSGRILTFDKRKNREGILEYKHANICNYPVQAFATADITPLAICVIAKRMERAKLRSRMVLQVHDAIVNDTVGSELDTLARIQLGVFNELPSIIEEAWGIPFNVPLTGEFEYGKNYGEMKKWEEPKIII